MRMVDLKKQKPNVVAVKAPPLKPKKEGGEIVWKKPMGGVGTALDAQGDEGNVFVTAEGSRDFGELQTGEYEEGKIVEWMNNFGIPLDDKKMNISGILFPEDEWDGFYKDLSNRGIWPASHGFKPFLEPEKMGWAKEMYKRGNKKIAYVIDHHLQRLSHLENPLVEIHDYQLAKAAMYLRDYMNKRGGNATTSQVIHIPVLDQEELEWREAWDDDMEKLLEWYLEGYLYNDQLVVHTESYMINLVQWFKKLFRDDFTGPVENVTVGNSGMWKVPYKGMETYVKHNPIGVDDKLIQEIMETGDELYNYDLGDETTLGYHIDLARSLGVPLIGCIGRSDYSKGQANAMVILQKMFDLGFKFRYISINSDPRPMPEQREVKDSVQGLGDEINEKSLKSDGRECVYNYWKAITEPELVYGFESILDIMLLTPKRDGYNMVANEFVASKKKFIESDNHERKGLLALSKFTGAYELMESFDGPDGMCGIDPFNPEWSARRIINSWQADYRLSRDISNFVHNHNVYEWSKDNTFTLYLIRAMKEFGKD
jgi:trehalose-6-phosphate synthase